MTHLQLAVIGSRLRTTGVFGKYDLSPAASLVAELAHGRVRAEEGSEARSGTAFRVGLTGSRGTFSYSANVRSIGANFVNPANRGLTPGGVWWTVGPTLNYQRTTRSWTASLQPSLSIPSLSISYNVAISWAPAWLANLVEAEVSSSWSRSESGELESPMTRRPRRGRLTSRSSSRGCER